MAMHARSGGNLEVMGMMQGKVMGDTFVVLDAFALPVEGTETRVNAQEDAYEYLVDYADASKVNPRAMVLLLFAVTSKWVNPQGSRADCVCID